MIKYLFGPQIQNNYTIVISHKIRIFESLNLGKYFARDRLLHRVKGHGHKMCRSHTSPWKQEGDPGVKVVIFPNISIHQNIVIYQDIFIYQNIYKKSGKVSSQHADLIFVVRSLRKFEMNTEKFEM